MSDGFPADDPWAQPPAPPPQPQAPAPAVSSGGGAEVEVADETSVTLKAHGGYNAPWIVVRAKDPERVVQLLNRVGTSELHLLTARAHIAFMSAVNAAEGNVQPPAQPPVQQAPQAPQAPQAAFQPPAQGGFQQAPQRQQGGSQGPRGGKPLPPGTNQEYCNHGAMTYREGNGQFGAWRGFTCTLPKNDPNACKAIYL